MWIELYAKEAANDGNALLKALLSLEVYRNWKCSAGIRIYTKKISIAVFTDEVIFFHLSGNDILISKCAS